MNDPLVSVVVPCFRQGQFLPEALQSVLDQTYHNWECIVVNDGSSDNTEQVAAAWLKKDKRFNYLYQENSGVSSARNTGIAHSKGEYILPLDADDRIAPEYIEKAVEAFLISPDLTLVYCEAEKFDEESGKWNLAPFSLHTMSRKNVIFCSALYKKKDWERVCGYDINMSTGIEDWEFWIALLKHGGMVKQLNFTGFYYRIRNNSRTALVEKNGIIDMYEYMTVKHPDFFVGQYGSFIEMERNMLNYRKEVDLQLKSEKFVVDLFCKRFFGFTIFGRLDSIKNLQEKKRNVK
ncbi:glycosyltransferase family A protein [Salinimicrobium sp. 3283s]|uniref:glycosyltransferase family 2 protein n=1 Tax=Salinimicrobium sp. 3283s TaxID=3114359 RepID=UPI0031EE608D